MEYEGSLPHSQAPANCPYPQPAWSSPYPHIPLLNIILPSMPRSPKWSLSLRLPPPKFWKCLSYPHTYYMPCQSHSTLFYHPKILGEQYRSSGFSLCSFLHSHVTSSPQGIIILLNSLFSKTLSLHSSLNMSDQISHPYKTTSIIPILYSILIFTFLDIKLEDKTFCTEWQPALPDFCLLLISS